jgi:hypothetical protein
MPSMQPTSYFAVVTDPATNVESFPVGSATLHGNIKATLGHNITYHYEYSTDPNILGNLTRSRVVRRILLNADVTPTYSLNATGGVDQASPANVTNLAPDTYYFQLVASDTVTTETLQGGILSFNITALGPSAAPTQWPSLTASTSTPSEHPTKEPSTAPTRTPSMPPSGSPTDSPSAQPSLSPSSLPSQVRHLL